MIGRRIKRALNKLVKNEKGQALMPLVLILLLIGGLVATPLLSHMSTGIKTGTVYENKAKEFYAADAGFEDGLWQMKNNQLSSLFPSYDPYDYTGSWSYDLTSVHADVNEMDPSITIKNIWVPTATAPGSSQAAQMVAAGKLIITGDITGTPNGYKISMTYYPALGENLMVETIGIWLPPGFSYVAGSSSLETDNATASYISSVQTNVRHCGGKMVVWNFNSMPFTAFTDVDVGDYPMTTTITFQFQPDTAGSTPKGTVSWVTTTGASDVPIAWDADNKVYQIISTAGSTTIEAYTLKSELRLLGSAIEGDYRALGNALMIETGGDPEERDTLLAESSATVDDIPSDALVVAAYLYWSGWYEEMPEITGEVIWSDDCNNFSDKNWTNGSRWSIYNNDEFQGRGSSSATDAQRTLTSDTIDLSSYAGDTLVVSWEQDANSYVDSDDYLYFAFYNSSSGWSSNIEAFHGDNPSSPFSYVIPQQYLTDQFKMRFYLSFDSTYEYAYLDDITIARYIFYDNCSTFDNWTAGSRWTISSDEFRGQGSSGSSDRTLTLTDSLDLSSYSGRTIKVSWEQDANSYVDSTDYLYFAFYNSSSGWSSNIEAFHDDDPSSPFSYDIPQMYLTDQFKMRFYLSFDSTYEYAYLDDIKIFEYSVEALADTTAIFKIDGTQVYFDAAGQPAQGGASPLELVSDRTQVINNSDYGQPHGYSYSCKKDVTALVRTFSAQEPPPATNHPGNGTYTTGSVDADWDRDDEWAYAGWSLVIIYSSSNTAGHQLYLYDDFLYCDHQTNLDFDSDGQPGGTISGFLVPSQIPGEVYAAKITAFVGEGDSWYSGDFIALNAPNNNPPTSIPNSYKLWDGISGSLSNVWNGQSLGMSADGVDVDTFDVTWASGLLQSGDTSAQVDIYTDIDIWNLVYIILSFRSQTSTGGAMTYIIK